MTSAINAAHNDAAATDAAVAWVRSGHRDQRRRRCRLADEHGCRRYRHPYRPGADVIVQSDVRMAQELFDDVVAGGQEGRRTDGGLRTGWPLPRRPHSLGLNRRRTDVPDQLGTTP